MKLKQTPDRTLLRKLKGTLNTKHKGARKRALLKWNLKRELKMKLEGDRNGNLNGNLWDFPRDLTAT